MIVPSILQLLCVLRLSTEGHLLSDAEVILEDALLEDGQELLVERAGLGAGTVHTGPTQYW